MQKFLKLSVITIAILSSFLMVWAKNVTVRGNVENIVSDAPSLYVSNCARCHGADGKGDTQLGREYDVPDLTTSRMSNARVQQIISKGKGDMPAFGKKLKAAQVTSLVNIVRSLRH